MLERITSPAELKKLQNSELPTLCEEIREKIIETVSKNGGHLGSNLGIVETIVAIHRVFDTPDDALIFDVGHQCYAHKLLTGRYESFSTLRKTGGVSGFVNVEESPYDTFTEGHSGTSLSQALGLVAAGEINGKSNYVIAVIGDGSFTNGMIYEALNNCKSSGKRLIIILNDNEMSISKNVGGLSSYLTRIRTSKKYFTVKHNVKRFFIKIPYIGKPLAEAARHVRDFIKRVLVSENLFECMGIDYIGTVDGNNVYKMQAVLEEAKTKNKCTLVHIHTKKGKGYAPAENTPEKYHSTGKFEKETGEATAVKSESFSSVFGKALCDLAKENPGICAVTAAMEEGTGLLPFKENYPSRFFDVGIAEEHAVTFAAGLAKGGLMPVVALYSTFAQRVYDQLQHDVAIQKLPLVLCLDRAGAVEGDGITHQGLYDISEFCSIPGINIYSPETYEELQSSLRRAASGRRLSVIRYPKGKETIYDRTNFENRGDYTVSFIGKEDDFLAVMTYGRITAEVYEAAKNFHKKCGVSVKIIKLVKLFPIDENALEKELAGASLLYFAEEGIESGGIGEKLAALSAKRLSNIRVKLRGATGFVPHGDLNSIMQDLGLTAQTVEMDLWELYNNTSLPCEKGEKKEVAGAL